MYTGRVVACFTDSVVFACSLLLLFLTVRSIQAILVKKRLLLTSNVLTGKSFVLYAVLLENLVLVVMFWLTGKPATVLHLMHDSAKFLLFSAVLYYFAIQSFEIRGGSRTSRGILWTLGLFTGIYVTGCSVYLIYDLVYNDKAAKSACKGFIWLTLCVGNCALSLFLALVGAVARHLLRIKASGQVFRRERKLWLVIWVLLVTSFLELAYDLYVILAKPNQNCIGFFPVMAK